MNDGSQGELLRDRVLFAAAMRVGHASMLSRISSAASASEARYLLDAAAQLALLGGLAAARGSDSGPETPAPASSPVPTLDHDACRRMVTASGGLA